MSVIEQLKLQLSSFSQLWDTEQETLAERAALVPDNGIIVEIGTAQGGSATIFQAIAGTRGAKIHSYDIAPSAEAYERLKNTNVTIHAQPSVEGAQSWQETVNKPIDLLFIDGSHALQHVFEDFQAWIPFLKPGGQVLFHDFDSQERGGLIHFGVQVMATTLLRLGILEAPVHKDRILYGTISRPETVSLEAKDCYQTFQEMGRGLVRLWETDYTNWTLVGDEPFANLIRGCLKINPEATLYTAEQAPLQGNYLVFARPLAPALETLFSRGIPTDSIAVIDNCQACYLVAQALQNHRNHLLAITSSRKEVFRWEEILFMFDHAFGESLFPERIEEFPNESNIVQLSSLVAREQVCQTFLARILQTLVGWNP